jgi:hypothetical protein
MDAATDPHALRLAKRTELFQRRGLHEDQADELACALDQRDVDFDDRRICLECAHLQRDGGCFAARQGWIYGATVYLAPVQTMLQRCECFELQKALSC